MSAKNINFRKSSLRLSQDKSGIDLNKFQKKFTKSLRGPRNIRKKSEDGVSSSGDECSYNKTLKSELRSSSNWAAEESNTAERRRKSYSMNWTPKMADLVNKFDRAHVATQQQLCMQATFLRHRKISTQLKVESLERQMELEQQLVDKKHQHRTLNSLCEDRAAEDRLRVLKNELMVAESDLKEMEKFGQQKLKDIENRKADTLQAWTALEQVAMDMGTSTSPTNTSPSIVISHCDHMDYTDEPTIGSFGLRRASDTPMSENEAAKMRNLAAIHPLFGFTQNKRQCQDDLAIPAAASKRRGRWKPFSSMRFISIKPFRRAKSADILSADDNHKFESGALDQLLVDGTTSQRLNDCQCNNNGSVEYTKSEMQPSLVQRTDINPESLAEIEAFENFIDEYFQRQ